MNGAVITTLSSYPIFVPLGDVTLRKYVADRIYGGLLAVSRPTSNIA